MSLSDEDKRWFSEQLDGVREQVTGHLREQVDNLREQVADNLREQVGHLREQVADNVREQLDRVEEQLEHYVREQVEHVETSLLTEFHKWASPVEARQRTHAAALRAVDLEMEALSDRVNKLESGPPNGGAA